MATAFFKLIGASNNTLLILFNMAVMSAAATFSIEKKSVSHVALGSAIIIISIILGGIFGFYFFYPSQIITIVYAALAFYLSKTQNQKSIFVSGAAMFFIFTALPFNIHYAILYLLDGGILWIIFIFFNMLLDKKKQLLVPEKFTHNNESALIVTLSLVIAFCVAYYLKNHFHFSYVYWIGLTILMIIQSAQGKTIATSLKRILVNTVGALFIVFLFNYVMPAEFWINFSLLVVFLFLIFALGFSYFLRTLFIELFVLGFTHLLGKYQNFIAFDRIMMTMIGGIIVILSTLFIYFLYSKQAKISH